jgi:hypothetical protein
MRSAIGFLIVLWGLTHFFGQAMSELNKAASLSFKTMGTAAEVAQKKLSEI